MATSGKDNSCESRNGLKEEGNRIERELLKFVIVGHVDHGKSTLIGRLLYDTNSLPDGKIEEIRQFCEAMGKDLEFGYVMDHLEEERDQGITIDTAQIFFGSAKRDYVIIDAPGHVEFLRNMITGASQAEAAILIVDAQEGVKEQTRRHAYLLHLLGLNQVIVAMNKMDLVGYREERFNEVSGELTRFLSEIGIRPTVIIPISAKAGDGVAGTMGRTSWYRGPTILEALDALSVRESPMDKPMRFAVQDVYQFGKRIVVGRVESGVIKKGDAVCILPSMEETSVASIEEFLADPVSAEAGRSTGFVTTDKVFVNRGDVVVHPGKIPPVSETIRANIFWMDKIPYRPGEFLIFRSATQEVPCMIERIEKVMNTSTLAETPGPDEIKNREVAEVLIRTDRPVVTELFSANEALGRFVLERGDTCAGGIVVGVV